MIAIPEADVFLGRRRLGRTPLIGYSLPAGTHRLDLRYTDGRPTKSVTARIRSGETTRVAVR